VHNLYLEKDTEVNKIVFSKLKRSHTRCYLSSLHNFYLRAYLPVIRRGHYFTGGLCLSWTFETTQENEIMSRLHDNQDTWASLLILSAIDSVTFGDNSITEMLESIVHSLYID